MSPQGLLERLSRWRLLREDAVPEPRALHDLLQPQALLRLCDAGALEGGLSVALDVRPEELFGTLCARMGGGARRQKLLDVREGPPQVLEVSRGAATPAERWEVEGTEALVDHLNGTFAEERTVRAVAVLGEWNEMWQLWCLERPLLPALGREPWFLPLNRGALQVGQSR